MKLREAWKKLIKSVPAIVMEVEKAMKDGKISADERRDLAWRVVKEICKEFGIKLTWFKKMIIGFAITFACKKLPSKDIEVPAVVLKITKRW